MKQILSILLLWSLTIQLAEAIPGRAGRAGGVGFGAGSRSIGRGVTRGVNTARSNRAVATNGTSFLTSKNGYHALADHEAAAEKRKIAEQEYEEQLKAMKEGRYIPVQPKGRRIRGDRAAELEEKRALREAELEERRLARLERIKSREEERSARRKRIRGQKAEAESNKESGRDDAVEEVAKVSSSDVAKKKKKPAAKKAEAPVEKPTPEQGLEGF